MRVKTWAGRMGAGVLVLGLLAAAWLAWQDRRLDPAAYSDLPEIPTAWPAASAPAGLGFSVLRTGASAGTLEALVVAGGSWFTPRHPVHSAVLVRHPRGLLLIDTGLGREVAQQFAANSALDAQLFGYRAGEPVVTQLRRHGIAPDSLAAIIPTHMHWDHISGLHDFPNVDVWVLPEERQHAAHGHPPAFIASQFDRVTRWRDLRFDAGPYAGFPASRDWFGDGSVVLVPLHGHTVGQVGLFLTLASGQRYFFIGDTTWTLEGLQWPASRPWLTRKVGRVDDDHVANARQVVQIHRLMQRHPGLVVVPAHDERLAATLPQFPNFQE